MRARIAKKVGKEAKIFISSWTWGWDAAHYPRSAEVLAAKRRLKRRYREQISAETHVVQDGRLCDLSLSRRRS